MALGDGELGKLRLAELDLDVGPFRDPQRVVARVGALTEEVAHLRRGLEVVLLTLELEPLRVVDRRARLHAQQRVVRDRVVAVHVVAVVRREHGQREALGDVEQCAHRLVLRRDAVILELDEEVLGPEDVAQTRRLVERSLLVAGHQRLQHVATETAGGRDEAFVVALEQLPVDARAGSSSPRGRRGSRA